MCCAVCAALVLAFPLAALAADTAPPSTPTGVAAMAGGAAPLVATVTWNASTDDVAVEGYYVYRAVTTTASPVLAGEVAALAFLDQTGVPGQDYYYSVAAFDAARNTSSRSSLVGPVRATWSQLPHATYTGTGSYCKLCHTPHAAAEEGKLMRQTGSTSGELAVCSACHDGQGASKNIISGPENSFALASGHTVEASGSGGDLTDQCSGCHNPHLSYSASSRYLPSKSINGADVDGADNTWCLACHNDSSDWYVGTYPLLSLPVRLSNGYPDAGTFPGRTVYEDSTKNAHASIPASGTVRQSGDCLYCHASHGAANAYDALVELFTPSSPTSVVDDQTNGTYAASCFDCHGGVLRSEFTTLPVNVKQFVAAGKERSGHRIETSGGTLPLGAPLPCYDCHNPHGSSRGNTMLISDELGQNLSPTSTGTSAADNAAVRRFCFTCHSTCDTTAGWDSVSGAYIPVGTTSRVEGLRRDGTLLAGQSNATGVNRLRIPVTSGHYQGDLQNCYTCHGRSYAAGGSNVHNPSGGVSEGGEACYGCHSVYEAPMEYNGSSRTLYYHHVLGKAGTPGDTAFGATSYPGSGTDVYCLSCHVDHDKFNANKASNLRKNSVAGIAAPTNSDYDVASPYGICLGCHAAGRAKDVANQKSSANTVGADNTANTPAISGSAFATSAHQYAVSSGYADATSFQGNCSKCHNDENQGSYKQFQTSSIKFGTHWDSSRRILAALGRATPVSDSPFADEAFCYRCHSVSTDGLKGTANRDWYGAAGSVMSAASQNIYQQFVNSPANGATLYKHGVATYAGLHKPSATDEGSAYFNTLANKHVECADCHNPHATGQLTNGSSSTHSIGTNNISSVLAGVRGFNWAQGTATEWSTTGMTYTWTATGVTKEYGMCLGCHSSRNAQLTAWNSNWTQVDLEFNTKNDSYHPVFGALPVTDAGINNGSSQLTAAQLGGGWTPGMTMYCSDCHGAKAGDPAAMGPHGSTARRVLKGYYPLMANDTTSYTLSMVAAGTATDLLCLNCHPMYSAGSFISAAHEIRSQHQGYPCTSCHISRPHGGKVSRLIVDADTTPATYVGAGASIRRFRKNTTYDTRNDCLVDSTSACGSAHGGTNANEDW